MSFAGTAAFAGASPFAGGRRPDSAAPPLAASPFAGPTPFAGVAIRPVEPAFAVSAVDLCSAGDGPNTAGGASFGPFDDFAGPTGTALASHAANPGPGAWAVHSSYSSSSLQLVSAPSGVGNAVARNVATSATSLYTTGPTLADVRATWVAGDGYAGAGASDTRFGVGLRVATSADTGYFGLAWNKQTGASTYDYLWAIVKRVAGVETPLATSVKPAVLSTPVTVDFSVVGAALTLKVDGSTVATATDSSISGPGTFAVLFQPVTYPAPFAAGSWIGSLALGSSVESVNLAPETVFVLVVGSEAFAHDDSGRAFGPSYFALASADCWCLDDRGRSAADVVAFDSCASTATFRLDASAGDADASGLLESASTTGGVLLVFAGDTSASSESRWIDAAVANRNEVRGIEFGAPGPNLAAVDSTGAEEIGFAFIATATRDVHDLDAIGWDEDAAVRFVVATVGFHVYRDAGSGTPIDYGTLVATTNEYSWTSPPLGRPGVWSFGVRASGPGGEERNLDAAVTIRLDAAGIDVSRIPRAPISANAVPRSGGVVKIEWRHVDPDPSRRAAGFRVYAGVGSIDYATPVATAADDGRSFGSVDVSGLTEGLPHLFAVKSFNADGESTTAAFASATPDASGPRAPSGLSVTPVASEQT